MARVLVIGYGNPLRGDDGLGWHAAEALRSTLPEAEILTVHQLTPELAEDASRAELVIFLDAGEGGVPGDWRETPVCEEPLSTQAFTHHVTPASLLSAARQLYGQAPQGSLSSMAGESFDYREGLSETVSAALPTMLDAVIRRCR
jgi:hydrogenase maturation protease